MKDLTRLYDQLTAEERFAAFMAAASRMDTAEMDALNATCPRKTYTMDDWEYTHMKTRYFHCWQYMQGRLGRISLALAAFALVVAYAEEEESEQSLDAVKRLLALHQTLLAAWQQFSIQAGIDQKSAQTLLGLDRSEFDSFMLGLMREVIVEDIPPPRQGDILKEVESLEGWWQS
jgi:predicted XRE-type DNA-binding protein